MQKLKHYVLAIVLAAPLLAFTPALAESSSSGSSSSSSSSSDSSSQTTTSTDKNETEDQAEAAAPNTDPTARQQRLDQVKTQMKLRLATTEIKHLQDRCKLAQTPIKSLGDKVNANVPSRNSSFEELNTHLTDIIAKLKAKAVDTTKLADEQKTLDIKISVFKTDLTAYKQQLSDLQTMDCAADPTAFKAALLAARTARVKLGQELADIAAYVKNTIKPTLVDLRQQLDSQSTTKPSTTTPGGNQ